MVWSSLLLVLSNLLISDLIRRLIFFERKGYLQQFLHTVLIFFIFIPLTFIPFLILPLHFYPYFYSIILILLVILWFRKKRGRLISLTRKKLKKDNLMIILFLILNAFLSVIVYFKLNYTIMGTDVGRFAIIAHIFKLNDKISANLEPYDMANGFFYFPGNIFLLLQADLFSIDPFQYITLTILLASITYPLLVFFIVRRFAKFNSAFSSMIASSLMNPILDFGIAGVFSYGLSILFFVYSMYVIFYKPLKSIELLCFSILGMLFYHWFLFIPFIIFISSSLLLEEQKIELLEKLVKASLISFLLFSPFLLYKDFWKFIFLSFTQRNKLDIIMFSHEKYFSTLLQNIFGVFFFTHVGIKYSPILLIGFFLSLLFFINNFLLKKFRLVFLIFYITLSLHAIIAFPHMNLGRIIVIIWIVYAIFFSSIHPIFSAILALISFFIFSPSIYFYSLNLKEVEVPGQIPWIVSKEFQDVIEFIDKNLPENSTFLIDGGGAGCTGASASYGERIFPLTSRKIYYFSDYCWANYNFTEYQRRVEIYNQISINPCEMYETVKAENITHIFIGPSSICLNKTLFENCVYYKKIYERNGYAIFKVVV